MNEATSTQQPRVCLTFHGNHHVEGIISRVRYSGTEFLNWTIAGDDGVRYNVFTTRECGPILSEPLHQQCRVEYIQEFTYVADEDLPAGPERVSRKVGTSWT